MRVLMQRVREAAVSVLNELNGIDPTFEQRYMGPGLVLTVEAEPGDDEREAGRMAHRILTMRCFDGPNGRLSASIQDIDGEIMSIPQPLTGVERPATGRPRLTSRDADADHALIMWIRLNEALRSGGIPVYEETSLAKYPTGNPILILLLMLLMVIGVIPLRKFKKE